MNRRDLFRCATAQIFATTSSAVCNAGNIESLVAAQLQTYLTRLRSLETATTRTFNELKNSTSCNALHVNKIAEELGSISQRIVRTEHRQQILFAWLLILTIFSCVDMFQLTMFFPVSYGA